MKNNQVRDLSKSSLFWDQYDSWEEAEKAWEEESRKAAEKRPLRLLKELPQIPGITQETRKNLKWKSLFWIITEDKRFRLMRSILRHPLKYSWKYLKSLISSRSYRRDGDFFLYGISSLEEMKELMEDPKSLLIVGFSYCEKPHECPSGRFTDQCVRDLSNPVCRQCFIGKSLHTLPSENTIPLIIPTIHYIGNKVLEIVHKMKNRRILFMITACEMTLEMFGDWGNMSGIQGIGVRLDGRICNTMRAFALSENGIKPGLTVVLPNTERRILDLLARWRQIQSRGLQK